MKVLKNIIRYNLLEYNSKNITLVDNNMIRGKPGDRAAEKHMKIWSNQKKNEKEKGGEKQEFFNVEKNRSPSKTLFCDFLLKFEKILIFKGQIENFAKFQGAVDHEAAEEAC